MPGETSGCHHGRVVWTEHDGPQFLLEERVLLCWKPSEDPLAGP
jgi:hypothetical protein